MHHVQSQGISFFIFKFLATLNHIANAQQLGLANIFAYKLSIPQIDLFINLISWNI